MQARKPAERSSRPVPAPRQRSTLKHYKGKFNSRGRVRAMALTERQLVRHLVESHKVNRKVAENAIAPGEGDQYKLGQSNYLRGWHDGMHRRIDADEIKFIFHKGHDV